MQDPGDRDRQERVLRALASRDQRLAGMYQSALVLLSEPPQVGSEAARVSMACHCMRELMTGLPSILGDTVTPRPQPSSGALVAKLPALLADHPELNLAADQDSVPVPRRVARAIGDLVNTASQERGRNRANAAALVTGASDAKHPAIRQWMDAYEFFVGWTHLDRLHERRPLVEDGQIRAQMTVVEDIIDVRTNEFFENLRSIERLLSEINLRSEEV